VGELLQAGGYGCHILEQTSATQRDVTTVERAARSVKAQCILGVGGGSRIDVGKMVATNLKIPFISVPTSAAHDGIASPRASIPDDRCSISMDVRPPDGVLADTIIIAQAPYRLLAAGCGDAIANLTAVADWRLAHRLRNEAFSSSAAMLSEMAGQLVIDHANEIKPYDEASAWLVLKALIYSGVSMAIANSSRPASGAEHKFSHALDRVAPGKALHGEQCGVGTIMMAYLHGVDWEGIQEALGKIGAPINAKELGVEKEDVIQALMKMQEIRPERYTILGDRPLGREEAERLARVTGVID
jgi:glycerol-1-phosphate dehydrogenase [NAD(P)+]